MFSPTNYANYQELNAAIPGSEMTMLFLVRFGLLYETFA
jgi:hypothetical protein